MSDLSTALIGIMKDVSDKAIPMNIVIAEVVDPPPNLSIKFGEQVIPSGQIYCSNYLLPHYHRDYTIKGTVDDIELSLSKMTVANTTSTETADSHTHPISTIKGKEGGSGSAGGLKGNGTYETHGDIWFEDTLNTGDEVLCVLAGVYWVVTTKITKMPSGAKDGV